MIFNSARWIIETLTLFLELGFRHILEGYDHLLFLAGLIVVTRDWRPLLGVISAFTVAHSTTLFLSALEILSLNPALTETLIAASIAYVGVENVVRREHSCRWLVAGGFGLIHGAGFSGHLTALLKSVMGAGNVWPPLIGFNLGIEAGQAAVIAVVLPALWLLKKFARLEAILPEISRMIAAVGLFLVISRIWGV